MKFASISTGILLLCFFAAVPVACRADQSNQSGNDFSSAVNLYMSAPVNSYDYQPAIDAFSKIAIEAKDKETEFRARYFLTLADFCATRFDEAYKQADACRALANQLYPEDISVKTADFILSGGSKEGESNFPALNDIIITHSRIKPIMSGASGENLLGTTETIDVLDILALLTKMWPTPVYRNGRDKINRIRQRGNITADETLVIGMMEKNIACLKESTGSQFALTCGVLALFIDKCGAAEDEITNNMKAAICCHNMRQIGIAMHMYLLDNNEDFPPTYVRRGTSTQDELSWIGLLMPYLGIKRVVKPMGGWSGNPDLLEVCPDMFLCPAITAHGWTTAATRGAEYGLNGAMGELIHGNGAGSGQRVKLSQISPAKQVLVMESLDNHRGYSPDRTVTPSGNVLYADGHVEMFPYGFFNQYSYYDVGSPKNPLKTYTYQ